MEGEAGTALLEVGPAGRAVERDRAARRSWMCKRSRESVLLVLWANLTLFEEARGASFGGGEDINISGGGRACGCCCGGDGPRVAGLGCDDGLKYMAIWTGSEAVLLGPSLMRVCPRAEFITLCRRRRWIWRR